MSMRVIERIAKRIRSERKKRKLTVAQLAEISKVSERCIYHLEAVEMLPRVENLDLLAKAMGIRIVLGGKNGN